MTKRRRMRLAEEQAAADAAEREAAAEERRKRREKLVAELGGIDAVNKAIVDNLNEDVEKDVFGSEDEAFPQEPCDRPGEPDSVPDTERQDNLGDEQGRGDSEVSGDGRELTGGFLVPKELEGVVKDMIDGKIVFAGDRVINTEDGSETMIDTCVETISDECETIEDLCRVRGIDVPRAEVKAITGSILRGHRHIPCDDDGNPIERQVWGTEGTFVGPFHFQQPPANPDAVICREEEDLSGDQNETEFEEEG